MKNIRTLLRIDIKRSLVCLLAAVMVLAMLPAAGSGNAASFADEDLAADQINLYYDADQIIMDTSVVERTIYNALRSTLRTDENVPYSIGQVRLNRSYDSPQNVTSVEDANNNYLVNPNYYYYFFVSLDMDFNGLETQAWPDDCSSLKFTLNGETVEPVKWSVSHLETETYGSRVEMKRPERLNLTFAAPEVTGFKGVSEETVLFTEDSRAVKGGHLTVDINKMAVGNEELQECMHEGSPGYQWYRNGNPINNGTKVTLELTDDLFKEFEKTEIQVRVRYSTVVAFSEKIICQEMNMNTVGIHPRGDENYYLMEISEDGTIILPECEVEPHDGLEFKSWMIPESADGEYIRGLMPGEKVKAYPGGDIYAVWGTADDQYKDIEMPYTDVAYDYYYEPVLWALSEDITNGTSPTTFSPGKPCTRAQIVTFLWRAAGRPEPVSESCPFTDVEPGSYYYDAVLWAVENDITNGVTPTGFAPDNVCTRAQVVTFQWRASGRPEILNRELPFNDVADGTYYFDAVRWAVAAGITSGTSPTTFSPDKNCTRAQIVTFLFRQFE